MASRKQSSFSFATTVATEQRLVLARQLDRLSMWECGLGAGPLKPEHELTENAMDETWEEEEEEMEEEESIMETQSMKTQVLEAYASLFFSRPFTLSQANRWTVAEESLIQTGGLWPRKLLARRLQARRSP